MNPIIMTPIIDLTQLTPDQPFGLPTYNIQTTEDQSAALLAIFNAAITIPSGKTLAYASYGIDVNGQEMLQIILR